MSSARQFITSTVATPPPSIARDPGARCPRRNRPPARAIPRLNTLHGAVPEAIPSAPVTPVWHPGHGETSSSGTRATARTALTLPAPPPGPSFPASRGSSLRVVPRLASPRSFANGPTRSGTRAHAMHRYHGGGAPPVGFLGLRDPRQRTQQAAPLPPSVTERGWVMVIRPVGDHGRTTGRGPVGPRQ